MYTLVPVYPSLCCRRGVIPKLTLEPNTFLISRSSASIPFQQMESLESLWLYIPITISLFLYIIRSLRPRNHLPLSGPRSFPVIGHLPSIPTKEHDIVFQALWWVPIVLYSLRSDVFGAAGDIIGLEALGKSIVVLNSQEVCHDLRDKRSAIYSDRPPFPMLDP